MLINDFKNCSVKFSQTVAWGDMDAFSHVNNVNYHRYIESARIYFFEQIGLMNAVVMPVVSENQCKYVLPLFYPDQLKIAIKVEEIRNSSFKMSYLLWSEQQKK